MPKVDFEEIRAKVQRGDYEISVHAFERMRQRGISLEDVENVIMDGEIIERDVDAQSFPYSRYAVI